MMIQKILRELEQKGGDILDDFEDNIKSGIHTMRTIIHGMILKPNAVDNPILRHFQGSCAAQNKNYL